jgi:hypothetical protein
MTTRVPITLDEKDALALSKLARSEYRDVRQQAAILVREGLERQGRLNHSKANNSEGEKSPITISFNCENHNDVLLLTTLFDVITGQLTEESNAIIDNIGWLVDEIADRLYDINQGLILLGEPALDGDALMLMKYRESILASLKNSYKQ